MHIYKEHVCNLPELQLLVDNPMDGWMLIHENAHIWGTYIHVHPCVESYLIFLHVHIYINTKYTYMHVLMLQEE